jgi:hypothetical protein
VKNERKKERLCGEKIKRKRIEEGSKDRGRRWRRMRGMQDNKGDVLRRDKGEGGQRVKRVKAVYLTKRLVRMRENREEWGETKGKIEGGRIRRTKDT